MEEGARRRRGFGKNIKVVGAGQSCSLAKLHKIQEHGKSHTVSATCIAYSALLQEQEGCAVAQLVAM